jgi:DNA adenine methylase
MVNTGMKLEKWQDVELPLQPVDRVYAVSSKSRNLVKWVGGKKALLPQLSKLLPTDYNCYYEPFFGGGALFFYLQPKQAHINDINETLIHTYKVVKSSPKKLCDQLCALSDEYLKLGAEARKAYYYERRDEFNQIAKPNTRKAALMIFLNRTCFKGKYSENRSGKFNNSFGYHKNPKI